MTQGMSISSTTYFGQHPKKPPGWCEEQGIPHNWQMGPTLTSNPPISTRECCVCGKRQHLRPSDWVDVSKPA
jgi:hypothetical protein